MAADARPTPKAFGRARNASLTARKASALRAQRARLLKSTARQMFYFQKICGEPLMSRRAAATQREIESAIKVVRRAGLTVTGAKIDGTRILVLTDAGGDRRASNRQPTISTASWPSGKRVMVVMVEMKGLHTVEIGKKTYYYAAAGRLPAALLVTYRRACHHDHDRQEQSPADRSHPALRRSSPRARRHPAAIAGRAGLLRPWTVNSYGTAFDRAKFRAKMSDANLHFHDLRGTAATHFYLAGMTGREIAEILGWDEAAVSKIIRRYVARNAAIKSLIERLNRHATNRGEGL
jgi:Phage integrase family